MFYIPLSLSFSSQDKSRNERDIKKKVYETWNMKEKKSD